MSDNLSVNPDNAMYVPQPSAYGRIIRERGTKRILLAAAALVVVWYLYTTIHTNLLNQKQWSKLPASPTGLVVLGLRDKDRPGWEHKYEARESNRSWQIRYNEDYMGGNNSASEEELTPETQDRGTNNPGAGRGTNSGSVVPMEELMRECPVVFTGPQIASASVEEQFEHLFNRAYYNVHLSLTPEGASRFYQFSQDHDEERIAFILDNRVLTCAQIPRKSIGQWLMPISASTFSIGPIWVKADAEQLANFINGQKK